MNKLSVLPQPELTEQKTSVAGIIKTASKTLIYLQLNNCRGAHILSPYSVSFNVELDDCLTLYTDQRVWVKNKPRDARGNSQSASHDNSRADSYGEMSSQHPIVAIAKQPAGIQCAAEIDVYYPKPLQQMPYSRAFKESILLAIPWMGFAISCFIVLALFSRSKTAKELPLKFTFNPVIHFINALLASYPFVLLSLDKSSWILAACPLFYLLFSGINLAASYMRNAQVTRYNCAILEQVQQLTEKDTH